MSYQRKVREAVYDVLNQVLEIGRHYKIHCVVTNHLPTNGKDTRRILNEAHTVTYFPHSAGGKIKYIGGVCRFGQEADSLHEEAELPMVYHLQELAAMLRGGTRDRSIEHP